MVPHGCFKCKGDAEKWVTIVCGSDTEWQALCQAMGQPELATDKRFTDAAARKANEDALEALITAWTSERDRWEVTEALQKAGVAAYPSQSNKDLATNPHLEERGYLVQKEHPEFGKRIHAGIPWQMSGSPCEVQAAAPQRRATHGLCVAGYSRLFRRRGAKTAGRAGFDLSSSLSLLSGWCSSPQAGWATTSRPYRDGGNPCKCGQGEMEGCGEIEDRAKHDG